MSTLVKFEEVQAQENVKNYKEFQTRLGASDIASLTVRFPMHAMAVHFGEDANYTAYVITDAQEVPAHYRQVAEGKSWCKVYDDEELMAEFWANKIEIYRAGEMGCLIRLIK
ncbi:hypothetical protein [Veillonella sp. CHU110]|uniref:hypothetical protein n=1 Tax=Veillonella sp. CHU110 TaxID=2490947 RepID=UPI000F8CF77A|nr:hypothetical protein [Veillonella sp. CHU110]